MAAHTLMLHTTYLCFGDVAARLLSSAPATR